MGGGGGGAGARVRGAAGWKTHVGLSKSGERGEEVERANLGVGRGRGAVERSDTLQAVDGRGHARLCQHHESAHCSVQPQLLAAIHRDVTAAVRSRSIQLYIRYRRYRQTCWGCGAA